MKGITKQAEGFRVELLQRAAIMHIAVALCGFLCSRAVILGSLIPFGIAFLSGAPMVYLPSAAVGAFLGYFFPVTQGTGFRYIASLFAILAIKMLVGSFKRIVANPLFLSLICLASVFLTSAVTFGGTGGDITISVAEAPLAALGTYFIARAFYALENGDTGFSAEELTSTFIMLSIIISGLYSVSFLGITLGNIVALVVILCSAKLGGVLSGCVSGIAFSFAALLSSGDSTLVIGYAFSGMIAGVFSSYGKYAQIISVLLSNIVIASVQGHISVIGMVITEAVIASAAFLLLPTASFGKLRRFFTAAPKVSVPMGLKKSLIIRLNAASNALKDVSATVSEVSEQLSKINAPDFSEVISGVECDACEGCKLRLHCWESRKSETLAALLEMTKAVKLGVLTPDEFAPQEFKERCIRPSDISAAVYKRYSEYAACSAAESRIEEVRSVISDQFSGISSLLNDLARDFEADEQFDNSAALTAAAALKNIDISVSECSSRIDKFGRMTIELKVKKSPECVLNKLRMMRVVSNACERDFDVPSVNEIGSDYFITFNEHARLCVDIGSHQIAAQNSKMCGDAFSYFYDHRGRFIMVLSDGMGTGGRAAVDGAMASGLMSRLLKAGFGYNCSLKILNSSMLFKSTDESLATVDIACLDLFTGKLELLKAGAAPTVVRRSGRGGMAQSSSLPAGILRNINFDRAALKMHDGDIFVLMSDGAASEGTDWIREELEAFTGGRAQELAEHICEGARRRRTDNHEDDITVLVAIIEKAV